MSLFKNWRQILLFLGDFLLFYAALWLALSLRRFKVVDPQFFLLHAGAFSALFSIWLAVFYALGLYNLRQLRDLVSPLRNLMVASAVNWAMGMTIFYFLYPFYLDVNPKTHLLLTAAIAHSLALVWRRIWLALIQLRFLRQKVVVLGDDYHVLALQEDLKKHPEMGYAPVSWDSHEADLLVVDSHWVDENWDQAQAFLGSAIRKRIPVVSFDGFYEFLYAKVSPEQAGNTAWMLEFLLPYAGGPYFMIKRTMDVLLSAVLLVVSLPLVGCVWLAIRLIDGAPVFYGQRRLGFMGREFVMWKFRTMTGHKETEVPFSSCREDDPRVTALGKVLRRFRLDEIPQIWNVLKGEMSLVGPRPEWVKEIEVLERSMPCYHLRHLVKPGITGWAQVYFKATNNAEGSMEKLRYDLYYVKNISLALDLSILLKTVKRVFLKDALIPSPILSQSPSEPKRQVADFGVLIGRG